MNINFPNDILEVITKITTNNHQIYLVGGALRDLLLNAPAKDWDFATSATPNQLQEIFPDSFYNNSFGTVSIPLKLDSNNIVEITTMRKETSYSDNRHPDQVIWTDQIEEDLKRRDFTINAMAYDPATKQLIDPYAGQTDLTSSIIRSVNNPNDRFKEDALRMMRAVRFAVQLQFTIEHTTFEAIQQNADLLQNIAFERIRDEFIKILASDYPYEGILLLQNSGLLKIILPELENCFGIVQEGPKHDRIYDIGEHSLLALKACSSPDPIIRFASLLHDIGKPDTYRIDTNNNVTFYNHEIVGAKIAKRICQRFRLTSDQTDLIVTLVRWHMFSVDEKQTDSAIRRIIRNIGVQNIDHMMVIREADRIGGGTQNATSWRLENFKKRIKEVLTKPFQITDLKINGQDVMDNLNIPPSRQVGEILQKLFEEVLLDNTKNTRELLLKRLTEIKSSANLVP